MISVIMSIYNEPIEWIQAAVDSILRQTYQDFEFIIINDNPSRADNTVFLEKIIKQDSRINIYHNNENIGLAATLNYGISKAKGKYIARMDADDISLPERFSIQIDFLEKNRNVGVCGSFARIIDSNGNKKDRLTVRKKDISLKKAIYFFCPFIHPTVMMRTDLVRNHKYDINSRTGEDWLLWRTLSPYTNFANISKILLYYRISSNNSIQKAGKIKTIESRRYAAEKAFQESGLPPCLKPTYIKFSCQEKISITEYETLFESLYNLKELKRSRFYLMEYYQKNIVKYSIDRLFRNRFIIKNPFLYLTVLSNSAKNKIISKV